MTASNMEKRASTFMRIESCRHCGEQMTPCNICEECPVCKEPLKLYCPQCKMTSESQIHQHENKVYA